MIYQHLFDKVASPQTVRAGLIGVGSFGLPIVTQAPHIPRLEVPVVADLDLAAGRRAFRLAGVPEDEIVVCESRAAALRAMEAGQRVVLQDALLMMDLPLEVIGSATRSPEAGAAFALAAIEHGKHVVMIDKEADTVVGPMLKHLADRAGLVYTTDDGDQPGLAMGLVFWARALGIEVLAAGNLHEALHDPAQETLNYRGQTTTVPEALRWALAPIPPGQAARYHASRQALTHAWLPTEACGDPLAHLAVLANGTGLVPGAPIGHRPLVRITELAEVLCPCEDKGILGIRGTVDTPTILHGAGETSGGGGVFIVVANDDATSRATMIAKGALANAAGTALLFYRPHHLCGAETALSMLCAGLLGVATGAAEIQPLVDITATTARVYRAGEVIGHSGSTGWDRDLRGALVHGLRLAPDTPLPFFMLEGNRLTRDVPAGSTITLDMIEQPIGSALWSLRRQQDAIFAH